MAHAARILLYFLFAGIGLTLIASGLMWWFEASRRLARALNSALGKAADAVIYDLDGHKAAGLDFTAGDLAIMWETGAQGLVFAFDEIEGAELIVDERVVARAQKGESRRVLNETHAQASRVTLRLMFNDVETPEFEVNLFGQVSHNPIHAQTAAEAVRLGRKWLSHIDAVIKRLPAAPSPYPTEESAPVAVAQTAPRTAKPVHKPASVPPPWEDDDGYDDQNDTYNDEKH
ncbi:hypothetical protein AEAC466_09585 [Asticcacaulis sp. AC466]|uniref:hypothetical protein n=1 Tax=Asticcacaulis sp. AC466 TaxID=1282362 RepID=UPI0003C3FBB4|nr:hypothetical protein [Asticcacaulis sp. AC466]ESQ84594.1 hypothetical protein AEAC466_09585 [Asticcacaulis sp. AC466]